jgi:hypothetical protein
MKGMIPSSNYAYFLFEEQGKVKLILNSLKGDADLYISEGQSKATYDLNGHQYQSASCGLDIVDIDSDFARPFTIGIYAHPSHDYSIYTLDVISFDSDEEEIQSLIKSLLDAKLVEQRNEPKLIESFDSNEFQYPIISEVAGKKQESENWINFLLHLLVEIFEVIFLA